MILIQKRCILLQYLLIIFLKKCIFEKKFTNQLNIQYFYRIYPTSVTEPYLTVSNRTVPNRTLLYVTVFKKKYRCIYRCIFHYFSRHFKHRFEDRHSKRYFLKNNPVTENIPLHLPLPLLSVTHA